MGLVTVTIRVEDETASPVDGVTIDVYDDSMGSLLLSTGTTGTTAPGEEQFTLNGEPNTGLTYNVRAYKTSQSLYDPLVRYDERRSIQVTDPVVGSNNFLFIIPSTTLEPSPDPNFCRITATVLRHDKTPYSGYAFTLHTRKVPVAIYSPVSGGRQGAILGGDRIDVKTDIFGEAVFDLVRGGVYSAVLPDFFDTEKVIVIPDASACDFTDLLFLYVKSVSYDNSSPTVVSGSTVDVEVTSTVMSDGSTVDCENNDWSPSSYLDPVVTSGSSFAEVQWKQDEPGGNFLEITGIAAGVATIQLQPKPYLDSGLPVRLPVPPVSQTTISVTVT